MVVEAHCRLALAAAGPQFEGILLGTLVLDGLECRRAHTFAGSGKKTFFVMLITF
jgi:hypothetical protein